MPLQTYDYPLSAALAVCTHAEPYRCWRNAVIALLFNAALFQKASYVEGWIVLPRKTTIEIIEHGWIVADHTLIDPSLVLIEPEAQLVFYAAGLEFSREELPQHLQGKTLPLVCHSSYGNDGMGHPGYQAAHAQAWAYAREQAHIRHLSETAIVVSGQAPTGAATLIAYA
jgi:hypothetical protein